MPYDTPRKSAWRNLMVAAINAGIEQQLFTIRPGDNRWRSAGHDPEPPVYRFVTDGIPAIASVCDIGWDELSIYTSFWPTADADKWISYAGAGFAVGEAY